MNTNNKHRTSARLADAVYNMPEQKRWVNYNRKIRVCSAEMTQNLIGENGSIEVAYEIDKDILYISYSGTEDLENWLYNVTYRSVNYYGYYIHEGFLQLSLEALTALLRGGELHKALAVNGIREVVHCGHSAGGAVAGIMPILLGLHEYDTEVIDFGTPKYLQEHQATFAELPYRRTRFVNSLDLVPKLPILGRYSHFGHEYNTTDGRSYWQYLDALRRCRLLREVIDQHSMYAYKQAVEE